MIRIFCVSAGVLLVAGLYLAPELSKVTVTAAEAQSTDTDAPASAAEPANWMGSFSFSLERQNRATPGGINEAEAVDIAMARGAAIREARADGRELSEREIASIGVDAPPVETAPESDTVEVASTDTATAIAALEVTSEAPVQEAETAVVEDATVDETEVSPALWKVTGSRVNLREGPGTGYSVLTQAIQDDKVIPLSDTASEWIEIQYPSTGETAWIFAKFLEPTEG